MTTLRRLKDVVALQQFGMVLKKAEAHAEIAEALQKIGYSPEILAQGTEFLRIARIKYSENVEKKDRYSFVQADLVKKKQEVERIYREHRQIARLICINDPGLEQKMAINGGYPKKYPLWLESVRKFYVLANRKTDIRKKLLGMGLSSDEFLKGMTDLTQLEILLANKKRLFGDLRLSTAEKNQAFKDLHKWMRIFFAAARLALKDKPELLQALERHLG